jgi:hypothetical protein
VQNDLIQWLNFLKTVGFDGWRFDFVKGYHGKYAKLYVDASVPIMAFGEYWDTCSYTDAVLDYNQDTHRQRTIDWIDGTGGTCAAFDFTTKGVLQVRSRTCLLALGPFAGSSVGACLALQMYIGSVAMSHCRCTAAADPAIREPGYASEDGRTEGRTQESLNVGQEQCKSVSAVNHLVACRRLLAGMNTGG